MSTSLNNCNLYLFGSIVNDEYDASDVDVLVVYRTHDDVASIRDAIAPHSFRFPLDVMYLSETEEKEFNFIQEQQAKPLREALA